MRPILLALPLAVLLSCATTSRDFRRPLPHQVTSVERTTGEGRALGFVTGTEIQGPDGTMSGWWVKDEDFRVLGFVSSNGVASLALPGGGLRRIGQWTRERAVAEVYGLHGGVRLEKETEEAAAPPAAGKAGEGK
jgi:hypothetical protein